MAYVRTRRESALINSIFLRAVSVVRFDRPVATRGSSFRREQEKKDEDAARPAVARGLNFECAV
jgi:hypothetical protein